jgi:hypothetical protein
MWKNLIISLDLCLNINHIKHPCITMNVIFGFFSSTNQLKKINDKHVRLLVDVMLHVIKSFLPMRSMVECVWLHCIVYKLCPRGVFPSKNVLWKWFFLPTLVEKTLVMCLQPILVNYMSITCTFDLWMLTITQDVFIYCGCQLLV